MSIKFDDIPAILMKWGQKKEQDAKIATGNPDVKNWQEVAMTLFEHMVRDLHHFVSQG